MCYRWKQFQAPTNFPANDKEVQFSKWLKSVRKDVECAFGILKKRFRCLKLPLFWKDMRVLEHVFVTCCMLHNMIIDINMASSLHGGWSNDEVLPPKFHDPMRPEIVRRCDDTTNYFQQVGVHQFGSGDGDGDTYHEWRDRYIDNFYYLWSRGKHKWPGPTEPNSSMRTTVTVTV